MKFLKKKALDRNGYDLALERIHRAYDLCDPVEVSFSGGKDTTICLQVTLEVVRNRSRLPLDVVFWDEEAFHPETVNYMRRVSQRPGGMARSWMVFIDGAWPSKTRTFAV